MPLRLCGENRKLTYDPGVDADAPQPELFVARDRARRFARYIRGALQERRLHYRGADVGMETVSSEADEALGAVIEDIRQTVDDVLAGRIRDRERGFMEVPLVTASEAVAERVDVARHLDRTQARSGASAKAARKFVLHLLDDALLRLDAYCGQYDDKRPVGPLRTTDVAHILDQVEAAAHLKTQRADRDAVSSYDRPPPPIRSDPNALDDVIRAARRAAPGASGGWRVEPAGPGRPLTLSLGQASEDAEEVPLPEDLARAVEVLAFLHPIAVSCHGHAVQPGLLSAEDAESRQRIDAVTVELADEAAGRVELTVGAAAGDEAKLPPDAEAAVRALMQSPPLPEAGPPPPQRLVALMGLLRSLDGLLERAVLPRARTNACRVAASRLPREATRKAPLRRPFVAQLEARFEEFPMHRVEALAGDVGAGKLAKRNANPADAAVLLALFGPAMGLAPLDDAEVEAAAADLGLIAAVRRDLERGGMVEPARITRLEQASIAVLGRLGRVPLSGV